MSSFRSRLFSHLGCLSILFFSSILSAAAQTPSPALLVLEKADNMLAIVDPATFKIVSRVPAGPDPHGVESSPDGKLAYISNYGGSDSALHTISVVDLVAQEALAFPSILALCILRMDWRSPAANSISPRKPIRSLVVTIPGLRRLIG
jgi:hypothetical protein